MLLWLDEFSNVIPIFILHIFCDLYKTTYVLVKRSRVVGVPLRCTCCGCAEAWPSLK